MESTNEDTGKRHRPWDISAEQKRLPAIGIVASEHELGTIARAILRANQRGFVTFVALPRPTDSPVEPIAERLGGVVLKVDAAESESARESVERISKSLGFPGLLHLEAGEERIDFAVCEEVVASSDRFGTTAPRLDEPNPVEVEVLAAIPAYNERRTIGEVVTSVQRHVDEVLVIDDGSDDDTVTAAERAGATAIRHERNRGYGAALKTAFAEAERRDVDALVILDGDGQHDPSDVPELLRELRENDANVVVGSRFRGESEEFIPRYRRVGLLVINVLTNLTLGSVSSQSWVSDTQSGFRAFDREAIDGFAEYDTIGDGMSASTDILYHARRRGYDIGEVSTTIQYEEGTSTQNPLVHGLSLVKNIAKIVERERPMTFLGVPGIAVAMLGTGFGYWGVTNYVRSGTFPAGIVLVCIFCTFLGSLLSVTGVILHSVKSHMERLYEDSL